MRVVVLGRENSFVLTLLLFEACSGRESRPVAVLFRPLGTMASLGHTRAVARVFGVLRARDGHGPQWGSLRSRPRGRAAQEEAP